MIRKLELRDVGPAPAIDMQFGPRLNLLTGDNGLGKSFVLDVIWWAATGHWPGFPVMPKREAQHSTPSVTCHFDEGRVEAKCRPGSLDWETAAYVRDVLRGIPARLLDELGPEPLWLPAVFLCAHVDGGCSVWDGTRGSVAPLHFSVDELRNGLSLRDAARPDGRDERFVCNGLIRDWVVWQLRRSEPFDLLCRVLAVLSPDPPETLRPGEPERISVEDAREYPTIEMPYGTVPIIHASAAVQRVVHLAYLLVWAWAENRNAARMLGHSPSRRFVFLIDEVEAHLHPRWQRLILRALLEVVRQLDPDAQVQVIATTHSPLVLASAEPLFDPEQDALFTFDLEGSSVVVRRAEWRTRGDASAWLTSDVFDLGEARSVEAERAIAHAREAMLDSSLAPERVRQIHHELRAVLKDTDPFWPRWLATAGHLAIEP